MGRPKNGNNIGKHKLPAWDKDTFLEICADRGYISRYSVTDLMHKKLNLSQSRANTLLINGNWRWEQMLVIGAELEMTPKEFAGTFLRGFFKENRTGHYVCHLDDVDSYIPQRNEKEKTSDELRILNNIEQGLAKLEKLQHGR